MIIRLLVRGQITMLRLFDGREPMGKELGEPLVPRIAIFFDRGGDPQVRLFQQFEIMGAAFATDNDHNLETKQTDNQLRFDRMAFFFPEYQSP